ncbi:E3 ubiquitin-protein ligase TRIM71-like isoform X2 [Acanthaster planci]|uniref:E3 ubiquitin-protein ligase TRIM71-like isoform X2 n=1 Tax=Acanthaster planci TaxID=133434 RepID=A0A8B7XTF5_ACAPL|nr:E3 ubiquitin-protein ligase TRIM71-like isoform X2 [Acanthaster planci]
MIKMATSVTAESVWSSIIQGHLECSICHTRYQEPKMLHCSHSFCLKCLQELKQSQHPNNDKVTCPLCKRETNLPEGGVDKLNTNYTLISLVEEVTKQEQLLKSERSIVVICQSCDEENEAMAHCMDCEHDLCQECQMAHQRLAALKHHTITPISELKESASNTVHWKDDSKCKIHPNKELCFYCHTCEMLICKECTSLSHKDPTHMFVDLKEAVDTCLQDAQEKRENYRVNAHMNIVTGWKSLRDRLGIMLEETNDLISQFVEKKTRQIKQEEKQLKQMAQVIYRKKAKKIAEMEVAEQTLKMVDRKMTDAKRRKILKFREELLHDLKGVKTTEQLSRQLSFISFKENSVVNLGTLLEEEQWQLFSKSEIKGHFIAAFSTGDMVIANTQMNQITRLSPDSKIVHVFKINPHIAIAVNKDDHLIVLFNEAQAEIKILNKEYKVLNCFLPGEEADIDSTPTCLAVDDNNLIAVGYKDKEQISLHNPDGSIIRTLPAPMIDSYMTISNQQIIYTNSNKKQLISVDYEDEMANNSREIMYTPDGKLVTTGEESTVTYHRV